ncbi:MAG: SurA N-terminal domain-containing protein [Nitrospirota bacterium]|nr:SurA N-terminal domain-containing protein [Nitrospirota bacterium]
MLKTMRQHAKYFYVLFFIIILSFLFWGVGSNNNGSSEVVAEVGKYKIRDDQYRRAYYNTLKLYRDVYKTNVDEAMQQNLKKNVLNSLIDKKVLLIAARKFGITVSDAEINEAIIYDPSFFKDGVFNEDIYQRILKYNKMTSGSFASARREELAVQKTGRLIELSAGTTETEFDGASMDEDTLKAIRTAISKDTKAKAVKAYIEGFKEQLDIKINEELIS